MKFCSPITNAILQIYRKHCLIFSDVPSINWDRSMFLLLSPIGGLTLATHLHVPFVQEVIAVSTALQDYAPQTDVAIELGGEDAKIIYFEDGNVEQRMNGVCAGGTGSFIDQTGFPSSDRRQWAE